MYPTLCVFFLNIGYILHGWWLIPVNIFWVNLRHLEFSFIIIVNLTPKKCKRIEKVTKLSKPQKLETKKHHRLVASVFFSFPFLFFCFSVLCCHHACNHPQEDLTTFGYRPAIKVEIY